MPGGAAPWLDTWAPAQFVVGGTGASGPSRSPEADMNTATQATYDQMLHWKIAGTIVLALVGVFVLQALGFRFVIAAGVGG